MRGNSQRAVTLAALFAPAAMAACSLINEYDALVPAAAADASTPDHTETEPDTSTGAETSADSTGADTVAQAPPSPGVIVIGGTVSTDAGDSLVLTALDPRTGSEFPRARVPMKVHAVEYESARDLWYVLESGGDGVYPLPTDPFFLHVRALDRVTGEWTEKAKVSLPPGVSFLTTAVLGSALTYVAYGSGGDGAVTAGGGGPVNGGDPTAALTPAIPAPYGLVTVDTTDLAAITACVLPLSVAPNGVIGTPNPTNPRGGYASLANYPSNGVLTPVLVPAQCDSVTNPPARETTITLPPGNSGFGLVPNGTTGEVLVASKGFGPGPALLTIYDPVSGQLQAQGSFTSGYTDGNIKPPAYSECLGQTMVTGTNVGTSVWVVPFGPNTIGADGGAAPLVSAPAQPIGHSGQGVYLEPFTNTLLFPFSQGQNFEITAFRLTGAAFKPITHTALWQPPPDLRPDFIGVRMPSPFPCVTADQ